LFKKIGYFIVIFLLVAAGSSAGYYFGRRGFQVDIKRNPPKISILNKNPTDQEVDFSLFWKVWGILNTEHIDRPLDAQKLLYGALRGLTQAVDDPYTSFLNPQQNKSVTQALNSEYEGIGAELSEREGKIVVVSPLSGSPAEAAGLKAQDVILEVDGKSVSGKTLAEVVLEIRGPAGKEVVLKVNRKQGDTEAQKGEESQKNGNIEINIARGVITLESVRWEDKGEGVTYIRIARFGEDTAEAFREAIKEIAKVMPNLTSVIIDVRSNPGGYLEASTVIVSELIGEGVTVIQELADGTQKPIEVTRPGEFASKEVKYVVLINEGSASASEIVAGSLRDNKDAVLVGKKSFGKGTIQDAKDFEDGSGIHITVAKWLTPDGTWVHDEGLTPDVEVEIDPENEEVDEQLEKAIEIAKGD